MPLVTVRIYPPLAQQLGVGNASGPVSLESTIESGEGLPALFQKLGEFYPLFLETLFVPTSGDLAPSIALVVDGVWVRAREAWENPLRDGAEVVLVHAFAGG
jgi:hypothetical protein